MWLAWLDRMRVPGCGVPPPPDSRRFSDNSQTTSDNANCNRSDDDNNNNNNNNNNTYNNNNENIGSSLQDKEYRSSSNSRLIARDQRRLKETAGGCLEHHGARCLGNADTDAQRQPFAPEGPSNLPSKRDDSRIYWSLRSRDNTLPVAPWLGGEWNTIVVV